MAFSASGYKSKLEKLSESSASIETLSRWVQFHKKAVKESAVVWAKEVLRVGPDRKLLYLYLANDIMQVSRKKGPEFVKEYGAQLRLIMPDTYVASPPAMREKIMRLLSIWEDRRVLGSQQLADVRSSMMQAANQGAAPSASLAVADEAEADDGDEYVPSVVSPTPAAAAAAASASASTAAVLSPRSPAPERVTLAQLLASLEEGRLVEELTAERQAGLRLEELEDSEVTEAEALQQQHRQALGAVEMLHGHEAALQKELEARQRLLLLLAASCERQQLQCTALATALDETTGLVARAEAARELVESRQAQMSSIAEMAIGALE